MNDAQAILRAIREGNEEIEDHYDDKTKKTASLISYQLPFTTTRVALLLQALIELTELAATEKKIRGEDNLLQSLREAKAALEEIYEPSEEERTRDAEDEAIDSRITQDKEDRS